MSTVNTPAEQRVVLNDVSWDTYLALVTETDRPGKHIAYDRGVMEIMSPGMLHENVASLIARMIDVFTEVHNIDVCCSASTTFKRDDLERGFEADVSYYIAHAATIRGKDVIDLAIDPPPDLAVEVDITRNSLNKFAIYAALGVPEIWRYDGQSISVYVRPADDSYTPAIASTVLRGFPFQAADRVLERRGEESDTALIRAFRQLIQKQFEA